MAVTFRGMSRSLVQMGNNSMAQNLFVVQNQIGSRVCICIKRLILQSDELAALAAVMPLIKVSRATGISGGMVVDKTGFDTNQTTDPKVVMLAQMDDSGRITATPGDTIWQQFTERMHTIVEQVIAPNHELLPGLINSSTVNFIVRPGESLVCGVVAAAGTSNPLQNQRWHVECCWEEDALSTFSISGTVTLSGSPVSGAKVIVLEMDDVLGTNAFLREVITTPAGGTWASSILTGKVGAAFVQYKNGATLYTAPGSPFLQ